MLLPSLKLLKLECCYRAPRIGWAWCQGPVKFNFGPSNFTKLHQHQDNWGLL